MDEFNTQGDAIRNQGKNYNVVIVSHSMFGGDSTVTGSPFLKENVVGGLEWEKNLPDQWLPVLRKPFEAKQNEAVMGHLFNRVVNDGYVCIKSYFDPNLDYYNFELMERAVITYDNCQKVDMIHVYHKPTGWSVTEDLVGKKIDALKKRVAKATKKASQSEEEEE